jgi:pyruvate/2-oxoacid:ferredoxin oxidoreductase beta subunit
MDRDRFDLHAQRGIDLRMRVHVQERCLSVVGSQGKSTKITLETVFMSALNVATSFFIALPSSNMTPRGRHFRKQCIMTAFQNGLNRPEL